MSCCTSKKSISKPPTPSPQTSQPTNSAIRPPPPKEVLSPQQYQQNLQNKTLTRSKLNFSANGFQSQPMPLDQQRYVQTKKVTHLVHDKTDRMEDYSTEINKAQRSQVILENKILNYNLDEEGGVSSTPVINTFHYQTTLNHHFAPFKSTDRWSQNHKTQISAYQSQLRANKNTSGIRQSNHQNKSGWLQRDSGQQDMFIRDSNQPVNPYATVNGQQNFVM